MQRRDVFRILTATALAGRRAVAQHTDAAPRFFTREQYETVDCLCEMLLPADQDGPGGREAGVAGFIDTVLHHADERTRELWRSGLQAVDDAARGEFGRPLLECEPSQQTRIMEAMAENEDRPATALQHFFGLLKRTAIQGFASSDAGRGYFGYRGDTAIADFPGCTHPEHQG